MTWSNASPQIELLAGINATPPLASQPVSSVQRFQVSSVSISDLLFLVHSIFRSLAFLVDVWVPFENSYN